VIDDESTAPRDTAVLSIPLFRSAKLYDLRRCSSGPARLGWRMIPCNKIKYLKETVVIEDLLQPRHLLAIVAIAVRFFGPQKLPALGKGFAEAIRNFKDSLRVTSPEETHAPNREGTPAQFHRTITSYSRLPKRQTLALR
jgi:sec-independent protein translocase protein TatA